MKKTLAAILTAFSVTGCANAVAFGMGALHLPLYFLTHKGTDYKYEWVMDNGDYVIVAKATNDSTATNTTFSKPLGEEGCNRLVIIKPRKKINMEILDSYLYEAHADDLNCMGQFGYYDSTFNQKSQG